MFAQVIVDIQNSEVDKIFHYIIPQKLALTVQKGVKVIVPFGNRTIEGYVIDVIEHSDYHVEKMKEIKSVVNDFVLSDEHLKLCEHLKNKFYLKMIDSIKLCLPTVIRKQIVKHLSKTTITINESNEIIVEFLKTVRSNAKNQIGVVNYLKNNPQADSVFLNKTFGSATVNKLIKENILVSQNEIVKRDPFSNFEQKKQPEIVLTKMQENAINIIVNQTQKPVLLHGVTGSGKTQVYLKVIENALKEGKTAIMLVPEISLTPQMVSQFKDKFSNTVAVLHSGLSDGEKHDEWYRLYLGEAKVVVGARSAIFAPINNVGVIIIDEEHDSSYVSDSNPRYNTTDIAIFRSKFNNCPLVLGSATPNIESYYLAKQGHYELVEMPTRVNNSQMPDIEIVDMLPEFRSGNTSVFSNDLVKKLEKVVENKNQAMLFINRRGYSSFLMCRDCGHIPHCEECDVSLVYHKNENVLKCHYCGKKYKVLNVCPVCNSKNIKQGGIGTERVVMELKQMFPNVPVFRMDNDTTTTKNSHYKILSAFEKSKPGILVGTQMITKGHDFPSVTFVGILDADLSLYFNSFRATEKTFQLITQVAGRAGRGDKTGSVILQTYFPKHYVYKFASNYDYNRFYDKEINLREVTNYPPFSTLVRVLISSEQESLVKELTHQLFLDLKESKVSHGKEFMFLEAMRSPVNRIKNKHRFQVVARFKNSDEILKEIYEKCDKIKHKDALIFVELNPMNLS